MAGGHSTSGGSALDSALGVAAGGFATCASLPEERTCERRGMARKGLPATAHESGVSSARDPERTYRAKDLVIAYLHARRHGDAHPDLAGWFGLEYRALCEVLGADVDGVIGAGDRVLARIFVDARGRFAATDAALVRTRALERRACSSPDAIGRFASRAVARTEPLPRRPQPALARMIASALGCANSMRSTSAAGEHGRDVGTWRRGRTSARRAKAKAKGGKSRRSTSAALRTSRSWPDRAVWDDLATFHDERGQILWLGWSSGSDAGAAVALFTTSNLRGGARLLAVFG